eukprot:CAMPEP_0184676064 /NCGR_PEP_ID=MMETSP0308-20130426/88153_1 /TAXON_ID=38269 /ORGANISM="Gloeochaete witrockiana, Strain SAG 46.84" /LENGTH=338 /DNA_ID=CAMNT_0027123869 /DNA_START=768 /DNA_END=1782 /DNA_ORIENTATION=+
MLSSDRSSPIIPFQQSSSAPFNGPIPPHRTSGLRADERLLPPVEHLLGPTRVLHQHANAPLEFDARHQANFVAAPSQEHHVVEQEDNGAGVFLQARRGGNTLSHNNRRDNSREFGSAPLQERHAFVDQEDGGAGVFPPTQRGSNGISDQQYNSRREVIREPIVREQNNYQQRNVPSFPRNLSLQESSVQEQNNGQQRSLNDFSRESGIRDQHNSQQSNVRESSGRGQQRNVIDFSRESDVQEHYNGQRNVYESSSRVQQRLVNDRAREPQIDDFGRPILLRRLYGSDSEFQEAVYRYNLLTDRLENYARNRFGESSSGGGSQLRDQLLEQSLALEGPP